MNTHPLKRNRHIFILICPHRFAQLQKYLYLYSNKRKKYREKDKKELEEHHTVASRYLLIDNIKDAYGVPYLYQSFCKSLIISSDQFRGGQITSPEETTLDKRPSWESSSFSGGAFLCL